MRHIVVVAVSVVCAACQCDPGTVTIRGDSGIELDAGFTDGGRDAGPLFVDDGGSTCVPPDVLIALDRTLTMHRTAQGDTPPNTVAGRALSKWTMAIEGIETLVAPPLDSTVRFGLELWPKEEPQCVTLSQRVGGMNATNASCEGAEVLVQPALNTGTAIADAQRFLELRRDGGANPQFVVLVTDGADWDVSCPTPNPLTVVDGLGDAGISTVVVGFTAEADVRNGVGTAFLNDMACAGGTAKDLAANCVVDGSGHSRARQSDAGAFFYVATNADELASTLRAFTATVCCGCIN